MIDNYAKYDVVRGISALIVVFSHSAQIFIRRLYPNDEIMFTVFSTFARHAVLVFFLLSGYLITNSILSNIIRNNNFDVTTYLVARIARIYPPLIGSIILVFICWVLIYSFELPGKFHYGLPTDTFVIREKFSFSMIDIYRVITLQNGLLSVNGPLWSLYIECIIYLVAMSIALVLTIQSKLKKIIWLFISIYIFFYGMKVNEYFNYFAFIWMMGSAVSIAKHYHYRFNNSYAQLVLIASLVSLLILGSSNPEHLLIKLNKGIEIWLIQVLFCILYTHVIFSSKVLEGFKQRCLVESGSYSYSLYITHFPLLLFLYSITQNWMASSISRSLFVMISGLVLSVIFASLFARYFENQSRFKPKIKNFLFFIKNRLYLNYIL